MRLPKFEIGEIVFAKMDRYKPWPAKIVSVDKKAKTAIVFFYGCDNDKDFGIDIPLRNIQKYVEYIKHLKKLDTREFAQFNRDASFMKSFRASVRITLLDREVKRRAEAIDTEKSRWYHMLLQNFQEVFEECRKGNLNVQRFLRLSYAEENLITLKRQKRKRLYRKAFSFYLKSNEIRFFKKLQARHYDIDVINNLYHDDIKSNILEVCRKNAREMAKHAANKIAIVVLNSIHRELSRSIRTLYKSTKKSGVIEKNYREFKKGLLRMT
jgi:hypothetical protein